MARPFCTGRLRSLSTFFVVNEVVIFHISRVKGVGRSREKFTAAVLGHKNTKVRAVKHGMPAPGRPTGNGRGPETPFYWIFTFGAI